jgi:hypothetical protein
VDSTTLTGEEPEGYLRYLLGRIGTHPVNRVEEPLPWNVDPPGAAVTRGWRHWRIASLLSTRPKPNLAEFRLSEIDPFPVQTRKVPMH